MVVWLLWQAHSATSSYCFILSGILIVLTSLFQWARKPAVVRLLIVAILALSLFALILNPGAGLVEALGRNSTLTGRTVIWQQVLDLVRNPLFGTGVESFWLGDRLQKMSDLYWGHRNAA